MSGIGNEADCKSVVNDIVGSSPTWPTSTADDWVGTGTAEYKLKPEHLRESAMTESAKASTGRHGFVVLLVAWKPRKNRQRGENGGGESKYKTV